MPQIQYCFREPRPEPHKCERSITEADGVLVGDFGSWTADRHRHRRRRRVPTTESPSKRRATSTAEDQATWLLPAAAQTATRPVEWTTETVLLLLLLTLLEVAYWSLSGSLKPTCLHTKQYEMRVNRCRPLAIHNTNTLLSRCVNKRSYIQHTRAKQKCEETNRKTPQQLRIWQHSSD